MRIWHQSLIPKLCRQHLLAMWREGLGAYSIITENKTAYRNHPAVKEFEYKPASLWYRLKKVRNEMIQRGYSPKLLPDLEYCDGAFTDTSWQTLEQQIAVLKGKNCECKLDSNRRGVGRDEKEI